MKTSPTQRSLKLLRELGYYAQVVERWNPFARVRHDLFGWVDILAVHPQHKGILGVQTTTGDHVGERVEKARGNPALVAWLLAGGALMVHGWRKLKTTKRERGGWEVRQIPIAMHDLTAGTEGGV